MDKKEEIEYLIKLAADSNDPNDALKYSQAAVNVANATCAYRSGLKL